jgi:lipopolysaccharide/colanic/teichoic acid biosynthesis glycosyltransferase
MSTDPLTTSLVDMPLVARRPGKRLLDVVAAAVGLALLSPLLLVIAVAIVVDSPGGPIFRQRRIGRDGREFVMWKFRTMGRGAENLRTGLMAASDDTDWLVIDPDPRVTHVGRMLRRTSVDELPQLVNVLFGQMSLVGPRPLPPVEAARVPEWARSREELRPGITGPWQISGRASLAFGEMLKLDCVYVREVSLRRDLSILLRTLPAVLFGWGAR